LTAQDDDSEPALWALDLEALKKSSGPVQNDVKPSGGSSTGLPIYTPQSARAYIAKAFDTSKKSRPSNDKQTSPSKKKQQQSAAALAGEREANLGHLLKALDMLYDSWAPATLPEELDRRTWEWYVGVRPAVADGVAGWGGKNEIKLSSILDRCRPD
jgi:hypothetical protein